jgi:hypothetical protein
LTALSNLISLFNRKVTSHKYLFYEKASYRAI